MQSWYCFLSNSMLTKNNHDDHLVPLKQWADFYQLLKLIKSARAKGLLILYVLVSMLDHRSWEDGKAVVACIVCSSCLHSHGANNLQCKVAPVSLHDVDDAKPREHHSPLNSIYFYYSYYSSYYLVLTS